MTAKRERDRQRETKGETSKESDILILKQTTRRWVKTALLCLSIPNSLLSKTKTQQMHSNHPWPGRMAGASGAWKLHQNRQGERYTV